jgi:UDP-glucose:(heptosyl)LPS alpha-1,3-glucosyltransferase
MKVVLAVFQLEGRGGKERDCLAVARALRERGHDVVIATTSQATSDLALLRVTTLPRQGLSNHARMRNFAQAVKTATEAERPDAVLAFDRVPGADFHFAADAAVAVRKPGWQTWLPRRRTYLALERGVFAPPSQTRFFFLTERQRDEYAAAYGFDASRAVVLPLILHDERYDAAKAPANRERIRDELNLPRDAVVAVSVAVKPRQKGVDRTLAALADHPALHLLVAGSSDDWIMQQAHTSGIAERVHVLPYVANVMDLMVAADFLAHPARNEAAGQVIGEALLAGTPAIVSAICGYADEVQRSGAGLVISEPFEPHAFSEQLTIMLNHLPQMRDGAKAAAVRLQEQRGRWLEVIAETIEAETAHKANGAP